MPSVSAVIITCNEAHLLRGCVESVRALADEIVVCDMESSDGSATLALELGCKVIAHRRMPAPDPEARTAVIEAASGDWILAFDPDMRLLPATARRLRQIIESDEADIVDFYCDNYFFGSRCPHGHGSQPVLRKLFKKSAFRTTSFNIHTFFHDSLTGRVLALGREHALVHYSYPTVSRAVETLARYARRDAEQAAAFGKRFSLFRMLWRPAKRLGGNLVLRQGFRNGVPGLIMSGLVAGYVFLIEAHLWELNRKPQASEERLSGGIPNP